MRSLLVLVIACAVASAQNQPEAERLFEEGRALLTEGKPEQACVKFEQSLAKDPRQIGVLMNLGLCNERSGKIATALRLYQEAFDRAVEAKLVNAKELAQDEINKLAAKVPIVTLARKGPPLPGEKLVIDDVVIAGTEVRLDPGSHSLVFTAPGRVTYETRVHVEAADRKTLTLPVLAVPQSKVVTTRTSTRRLAGMITAFGGLGIALGGATLAIYAKQDYDKLFNGPDAHCGQYTLPDGTPGCDEIGQPRSERDRNLALTGSVIGAVGLVASAAGLVLWLTAPADSSDTVVQPTATATSAGLVISGVF